MAGPFDAVYPDAYGAIQGILEHQRQQKRQSMLDAFNQQKTQEELDMRRKNYESEEQDRIQNRLIQKQNADAMAKLRENQEFKENLADSGLQPGDDPSKLGLDPGFLSGLQKRGLIKPTPAKSFPYGTAIPEGGADSGTVPAPPPSLQPDIPSLYAGTHAQQDEEKQNEALRQLIGDPNFKNLTAEQIGLRAAQGSAKPNDILRAIVAGRMGKEKQEEKPTTTYLAYQEYAREQAKAGKPPMGYAEFLKWDANLKNPKPIQPRQEHYQYVGTEPGTGKAIILDLNTGKTTVSDLSIGAKPTATGAGKTQVPDIPPALRTQLTVTGNTLDKNPGDVNTQKMYEGIVAQIMGLKNKAGQPVWSQPARDAVTQAWNAKDGNGNMIRGRGFDEIKPGFDGMDPATEDEVRTLWSIINRKL